MNGSDPIDDPLARPPRVVHAGSSRSGADAIRFVLREEGIPAVVESRRDDRGSLMWATIVAQPTTMHVERWRIERRSRPESTGIASTKGR